MRDDDSHNRRLTSLDEGRHLLTGIEGPPQSVRVPPLCIIFPITGTKFPPFTHCIKHKVSGGTTYPGSDLDGLWCAYESRKEKTWEEGVKHPKRTARERVI